MDADFKKKYGKYIKTGDKLLAKRKDYKILKVSPALDIALGGGIKEGSWVMISGDPKKGKTTIVMQIIKNAQEEGRPIMYLNVEGRLKEMNFEVEGLDPAKMIIVEAEDKPLSAETYFDIARAFIEDPENEGGVLIIDSLSSLIPAKDLDEDISGMTRPGLPKVISDFCKKLGQIVPNQRSFIIAITHMITNTSGYGKSKNPDGGVKIQFQADTRLEVKSSAAWEAGSEKIGIKTVWEILASSVGAPYKTAETWIRFGKGIDKVQEIIILACELGLISKSGSWYYLDFLPEPEEGRIKFQGQEKIHDYLSSHPEHYKVLEEKLKEIL